MNKKPKETLGQEHTWLKFALTDTNLEEGTFKGMASVFGSIVQSWMPTIIDSGAFTKTLQENFNRIKLLWQHDSYEPIGIPTSLQENQFGLELEGKISKVRRGEECLTLMRDGVITELSIGFDPIKWEMEQKEEGKETIRHVKELRLWEISPVTFAADPMAQITAVHSLQQCESTLGFSLDEFSEAIQELHTGKVLSAKNKKLLSDAVAALQALIDTAEPPSSKDEEALTVNMELFGQLCEAELLFAQSLQL
jgi:HK97 family phage prohead protease